MNTQVLSVAIALLLAGESASQELVLDPGMGACTWEITDAAGRSLMRTEFTEEVTVRMDGFAVGLFVHTMRNAAGKTWSVVLANP